MEAPNVAIQHIEPNYLLPHRLNIFEGRDPDLYNYPIQGNSSYAGGCIEFFYFLNFVAKLSPKLSFLLQKFLSVPRPRSSARYIIQGLTGHGHPSAEPQVLSSQHGGQNNSYQSLPQSFESPYLGQFTSPLSQISPAGEYGDALPSLVIVLWY